MCSFCDFNEEMDWFGEESIYTETANHHAYFSLEGIPSDDNSNETDVTLLCFQDKGGMSSDHWDSMTIFYCPMCGRKF